MGISNADQEDLVTLKQHDINQLLDKLDDIKNLMFLLSKKNFSISNGTGDEYRAKVNLLNALKVQDQRLPVDEDKILLFPYSATFKNSGSTDMRVNGSTSNVDFTIESSALGDIYVDSISFRIADVNATADKFGTLSALTNGVQLIYSDLNNGENQIGQNIQTNFDLVRLAQGNPSFGSGTDAFRIGNASGNSEGYIPVLDFSSSFGLPWGIRLRKDKKEKIIIRIRDNITAIDAFDAVAYGFLKKISE